MKGETFFEDSLKEKVTDFRLIPSRGVWGRIYSSIHGSRRSGREIFLILLASIILSGSWLRICEFSTPKKYLSDFTTLAPQKDEMKSARSTQKLVTVNSKNLCKNQLSAVPDHHHIKPISSEFFSAKKTVDAQSKQEVRGLHEKTNLRKVFQSSDLSSFTVKQWSTTRKEFSEKKKPKFLNLYITPSVSYRFLYNKNIIPEYRDADPEKMVSHHPSSGIEAGVAIVKPFSKRWNFKTGVQLNFSRYEIRALQAYNELIYVSTNTNAGIEQNSNNGNLIELQPKKLMNEHVQISLPIGLEYKVAGNNKISFHLAGTIQPSYTIQASGYMATSNYKNYIQADHLFRRYNVQSTLESYIKINAGIISLQAGPQIRYQLLSNTTDFYPIGEHLVDYGFKFGIFTPLK